MLYGERCTTQTITYNLRVCDQCVLDVAWSNSGVPDKCELREWTGPWKFFDWNTNKMSDAEAQETDSEESDDSEGKHDD